ncbi:hypothetical protein Bca4012_031698 [Brassica carinata]
MVSSPLLALFTIFDVPTSSKRASKPPNHLQDYHLYSVNSSPEHPISNVLSYSDPYMVFINAINSIHEPHIYAQASKLTEWCDALGIEIKALENNDIWLICSLPHRKRAVVNAFLRRN